MNEKNLTEGSVFQTLVRFSLPFLLSSFLQTFYGLADLFIAGQFNGSATITAVSVGSQLIHMLTVIIVGLAMGSTVMIGRYVGGRKLKDAGRAIGNTVLLFAGFALLLTAVLLLSANGILTLLAVPSEAMSEARAYAMISFAGVPFIVAYNVISSIFRGLGDSKRPMYFVAIAGVINVGLDYLLIGPFGMGAAGAALATISSQLLSVLMALAYMKLRMKDLPLNKGDFKLHLPVMKEILSIGIPIACQDGFIQISFLVITAIANKRGVDVAAAVGIVEKVISFLFLVPSAMLSSVSAIAAQNAGAKLHDRSKKTLFYAITIGVVYSIIVTIICQFQAENVLLLFAKDEPQVIAKGAEYLKSYVFDCIVASIHFCFSGYFCAYQKSILSFIHNVLSVLLVRIPGAYLATRLFPATLYPMGWAPPAGSLLSAIFCIAAYMILKEKLHKE
ncbi:MAG: MATE family efflux transporter [Clostridiales bacterium]|nr:MATE family efflux transporter [Candidatus Blautia equi]